MRNSKWSVWRRYTRDAALMEFCKIRQERAGEWELYWFGQTEAELQRYFSEKALRAHFGEVIWAAIDGFAVWDHDTQNMRLYLTK